MILSTHQPYFAPYPGFFHKAVRADILVLLDEVQFPRGTTWLSRNRFKSDQGTLWMTVPVKKKGLGLQRISRVRIQQEGRWAEKHLASLRNAYKRAPWFSDHFGFLEKALGGDCETLMDLNLPVIRYLLDQFSIRTEVRLLSELNIQETGDRLLIEICKKLGASRFLAQGAAAKYLDGSLFHDSGIRPEFFSPPVLVYPQLWGDFLPNLSAFDLLFNCGPRAGEMLRRG
jgi:hypothetical protein